MSKIKKCIEFIWRHYEAVLMTLLSTTVILLFIILVKYNIKITFKKANGFDIADFISKISTTLIGTGAGAFIGISSFRRQNNIRIKTDIIIKESTEAINMIEEIKFKINDITTFLFGIFFTASLDDKYNPSYTQAETGLANLHSELKQKMLILYEFAEKKSYVFERVVDIGKIAQYYGDNDSNTLEIMRILSKAKDDEKKYLPVHGEALFICKDIINLSVSSNALIKILNEQIQAIQEEFLNNIFD